MRLAFLTARYPKVSHTFIRREIQGLESLGHSVLRLSVHATPRADLAEPADVAEAADTCAFFAASTADWIRAAARGLARRPAGVLGELLRACAPPRRSGPSLARRLAYLLQALYFLDLLGRESIEHVHVHFGRNAACVARILHRLGGPGYSLAIHGPDEFDDPIGHELGAKVADSRFTAVVSDYTGAQLRRFTDPRHWSRIERVGCAVGDAFLDAARPIDPRSRTLVCVGRLCPQKGQLLLLEAFARVRRAGAPAQLVLAGDGELRPEIEARVRALGLEADVAITGWLSEAEVRSHLLAARALVLPSFAEGLPVVIMEALALERPVLSTFIAGIPELVRPGENGWLVPAGNLEALAAAMTELLERPAHELDALGRAGAERVRARHGQAGQARHLEALLARHVGSPGAETG